MTNQGDNEQSKVIWITGASSGIGRQLALAYAARGETVAVSARKGAALTELAAEAAGRIVPFPVDVTDGTVVTETVAQIERSLGPISLAILNAGVYLAVEGADLDRIRVETTFQVNVAGTFNCAIPLISAMRGRGAGTLAVVSSVAGYGGLPTSAAYGASKAALINLAEALKLELAPAGIDVRLISPGFVDTPATRQNAFPMPFLISADDAAKRIVAGLDGSAFEITFPRRFTWMLKLVNLLPYRLYFPIIRNVTRTR